MICYCCCCSFLCIRLHKRKKRKSYRRRQLENKQIRLNRELRRLEGLAKQKKVSFN